MKKRRYIFGALVGSGVLLTTFIPSPVSAANDPGGCPQGGGFFLLPTRFIIDELDNGNFHDQNGDGLVCVKVNKGQTEKNGNISFTVKDNTNPLT